MFLQSTQFVSVVLSALKGFLGSSKDVDLAKALGVSSNTLNNWESRNSLNFSVIIKYCLENNIELNALFTRGIIELTDSRFTMDEIRRQLEQLSSGNDDILLALSKMSTEFKLDKAKGIAAKVSKKSSS